MAHPAGVAARTGVRHKRSLANRTIGASLDGVLRPVNERAGRQIRAVVQADGIGSVIDLHQLVKHANHARRRDGGAALDAQRLAIAFRPLLTPGALVAALVGEWSLKADGRQAIGFILR